MAIAAALFCAIGHPAAAQLRLSGADGDVLIFRTPAQVERIESFPLGSGEAEALTAFERDARYYGALYVDPTDDDNSIFMIDTHSLAVAEALAEAGCSDYAGEAGRCVLYARVVPTGYPVDPGAGTTLSESATEDFLNDFIANKEASLNGAFAVSGVADWIYYLMPDPGAALAERAKSECEASARTTVGGLPPSMTSVAAARSMLLCRVIYLRYSDG